MTHVVFKGTALAVAMALSGMAHAQQCTDQSFTITFDEYAAGTYISSQYGSSGVLFASGGSYPFISPDGSNPTAPVLSGDPQFEGPITAAFVSPSNIASNVSTSSLSFDAGYFDEVGSTTVTFRDINNASLGTATNQGTGIVAFSAPKGTHSFTIATSNDSAGFAIDNMKYVIGGNSELQIASPSIDQSFSLTQNNRTRSPNITFQAGGSAAQGQVSWKVTMDYDTSRPRGMPNLVSSFNTNGTATKQLYYQSRGGRGTVEATAGQDNAACPLEYFYVVGNDIPAPDITTRLVSLYNGATPRLFTGIASKESTYRQFATQTKYEKSALWPLESYDGGSHVGLMQVATSGATIRGDQGVRNAWDWLENTAFAADLFREKGRIAASLERRIRHNNRGLRALTNVESENMALTLYGPGAQASLNGQYYRAFQSPDGSVDWIVNTANNPDGVAYANSVRQKMQ